MAQCIATLGDSEWADNRTWKFMNITLWSFLYKYDSLQPFPTSRWFENLQNSWTKFIFQIGSLNPKISMSTLHSTELFLFSRRHNPTKNAAPFSANKYTHTHTHSISWRRANARKVCFQTLYGGVINSVGNTSLTCTTQSARAKGNIRLCGIYLFFTKGDPSSEFTTSLTHSGR